MAVGPPTAATAPSAGSAEAGAAWPRATIVRAVAAAAAPRHVRRVLFGPTASSPAGPVTTANA
jgi:hypothetical protein